MLAFYSTVNRMSYRFFRPLLFLLGAETAHNVTLKLLQYAYRLGISPRVKPTHNPITVCGLTFANPIGLAAGLDKNGQYIDALSTMGFGFIEVGTVTPRPQFGNPKPRLFRIKTHRSIINRMGFNNHGIDQLIKNLKKTKYTGILGINIGKNSDTPNEQAVDDYLICYRKAFPYANYITINISSPNTKGLRDLQHGQALETLLKALSTERQKLESETGKQVPLWVKVAPDLDADQVQGLANTFNTYGVDAVIATNTLLSRHGIEHINGIHQQGGISGELLTDKSTQVIKLFAKYLNPSISIIGVGGIHDVTSGLEKLNAGASLLQVYSGLVYEGPQLIQALIKACRDKSQ